MIPDDDLPAPSSLLSSRWSRDNLVTCHPAPLYDGPASEGIDLQSVEHLVRELENTKGPIRTGACRMGVYTWDVSCATDDGPFVLQIPRTLDQRGARGRAKSDVPRLNVEIMRHFIARGLGRFVVEPGAFMTLGGNVPAATFAVLPDHRRITFGRGAIQVELEEGKRSSLISLGLDATADLLAEMVGALAYHYEPDADGGTAVTDVCINDGDFAARRRSDGSFDLRLTAARRREPRIYPSLLLLYFIQMMAYEDWTVDGDLLGLPTLIGNPSVAFEGVVRGLRARFRDLGRPEDEGARQALRWIGDFGRSPEGRSYRPWVDRFIAGRLPLSFGGDLRERWWRTIPLRTKLGLLDLRARQNPASRAAASARTVRAFLDRLSREIGRAPEGDPAAARINDLGRDGLLGLLEEAQVPAASRDGVADQLLAHWPYRSLDHLLAQVPGARGLRRLKSRIAFGRVVPDADQGTLASLGPPPPEGGTPRPVANPEMFGRLTLPPSLHEAALRTFPTFEAYMDAGLHDPRWGYYAHHVSFGRGGHFITNPESLSPQYGKWIATCAFRCWRDMVARRELSESDPFPIIEFGAGNGRLAHDVLDAVAQAGDDAGRTFASRLTYRIYETSASLRDKQRALLGDDAYVTEGDARRPGEILARDFPGGVRGLVLTNEVPDAFGVHKIVLSPEGEALAALVVPRVEAGACASLGAELARRIADADRSARQTFGLEGHAGDLYLDAGALAAVMEAIAGCPAGEREGLRAALWFEEAYVPASAVPELAAHLAANAAQYATALAAEDSGVVLYVNVHAARFIHQLASSLAAGYVVTIDYGDTTWGLVQGARRGELPFRVYGDQQDFVPRPNDPYASPGTQDMTADVNFTDLARAAEAAGLNVIHFGPERDLVGDDLPEMLQAAAEQESVAEFLGNPVFKVLVLGTGTNDFFTGPLVTPLALSCRELDLPKSRRGRIAAVQKRLTSGDPSA